MSASTVYQLSNNNGLLIEFISYGAKLTAVKIPEGDKSIDILLGYDTPEQAINGDVYMGAICGRYANRISGGGFNLEGEFIKLNQNDGANHLHGGHKGFNVKDWKVEKTELQGYSSAYKLSVLSNDGDENYPGNLNATIIYALNDANEFLIDITATTDKTTVVNLTSHPYFNLKGAGNGDVLNHILEISAKQFTPLSTDMVPSGEMRSVKNTAMDFTKPVVIKDRIDSDYEQIQLVGGLDHNWIVNKQQGELALAAKVTEPKSGRSVEVYTTQPGIQVYTAMHFNGSDIGKGQVPFKKYCGIALEAQNFPDAPNHSNFPSSILKPQEKYQEKIQYKFTY
ncbi:MAG: galactose mutarotase [Salinivirgaceae bacterium]|nr:galactose mutarotase [Salinivirgaceae bacterium]